MSDTLQFSGAVEIAAAGSTKTPTVSIVAYDGGEIRLPGWGTVIVDLAGADVSGSIPILANHGQAMDDIAGQGQAQVRNGQILVSGVLTEATPAGKQAIALGRSGVSPQASIGFAPDKREFVRAGDSVLVNGKRFTAGPEGLTVVRSGRLREISLVPVGANAGTEVQISAKAGANQMAKQTTFTDQQIQNVQVPDELKPAWEREGLTPQERVLARWNGTKFHDQTIRAQCERVMVSAAAGTIDYVQFENELLKAQLRDKEVQMIKAEMPQGPAIHSSQRDQSPEVLQAAFCRAGGLHDVEKHFRPEVLEACDRQRMNNMGISELLLRCAAERGVNHYALRTDNLREVLQAAFSTHTLTTLLTSAGNKFLLEGFNATEQVWKSISKSRPVNDFKEVTSYRMTSSMVYDELGPSGEIHHGTVGQESYTNRAKTYAKMISFNRQEIINDDLGALDDLRNRLGRGAGLKLNDVFWKAFLDNASFFTTARGNAVTGNPTLSATGLGVAEQAFLDLSDDDGHPLGITPAYLLVPTSLSVLARQLYAAQEMRDTTANTLYTTVNLWQNRFKPLVSAYIGNDNYSGYSTTAWYLLAEPANLPVMEVAFLNGNESPTIESAEADFNELGIQYRGYHDFGVVKAEWRAGVKSTGLGS